MSARGDYGYFQSQYSSKNVSVDILTGTANYADVITPKSANHQIWIQKISLSITTHAADTYTFDDDGAGPNVATHLDVTPQAAGVPGCVVFDFGPQGRPLTKGANFDIGHSSSGVGFVHIEAYEKLVGPVAVASTN